MDHNLDKYIILDIDSILDTGRSNHLDQHNMDIVSIMVLYRTFGELLTALAPSSSSRHPGGIWGCQNSKNSGVSGNFLANLLGAHRDAGAI